MKLPSYQRAGSKVSSKLWDFFRGIATAFLRLGKTERIILFSLMAILLVLLSVQGFRFYCLQTKIIPTSGGEYTEILEGEAKYLNPILAKTDAERAIVHIVYSALIKMDGNNQPQPDLATSWGISSDGLNYTFHLRPGVYFQKGQPFSSSDVAATIALIQDENNKSPLRDAWTEVDVETPDSLTVIFKLPKAYGPFIANCILEIMSGEDAVASLSSLPNGTGPYSFKQSLPLENKTNEVSLEANPNYFAGSALLTNLKFIITPESNIDAVLQSNENVNAIAGAFVSNQGPAQRKDFQTGRGLVMFMNLHNEVLKNIEIRKKIVQYTKLDVPVRLKLVALDAEPQKLKIEELKKKFASSNLDLDIHILPASEYALSLEKHDYDLLLYGYDWSYDQDPYMFWHSSQSSQSNFDDYNDRTSDILLEDARMISDDVLRAQKYQEFYQKITSEALAIYFDRESYSFSTDGKVRNIIVHSSGRPEDRFNNITNWYMKERRVKK